MKWHWEFPYLLTRLNIFWGGTLQTATDCKLFFANGFLKWPLTSKSYKHEKGRAPGCLGYMLGMKSYLQFMSGIIVNHYIRIPTKKSSSSWKVRSFFFIVFRGSKNHDFKKTPWFAELKPWKVCKLLVPGIILKNVRGVPSPFFWDHSTSRSFGRGTTRSLGDNNDHHDY